MRVLFSVLSIVLIIGVTFAIQTEKPVTEETSSQLNLEDAKFQELEDSSETPDTNQDTEIKRRKKSTTTTFCVEIRPSGPFQKPFQVCEPSEPSKPATYSTSDASSYYAAPSYATQELPKSQAPYQPASGAAYKPASQQKPAPAYSSPVKTFSAPSVVPVQKPFASHPSMSYSTYRSKSSGSSATEDSHNHVQLMRMTHASNEDTDYVSLEDTNNQKLRSASYGSYGSPTSIVPMVPKEKHKMHNGLVITCQPNLAGYAHNVPSSFHHPSAVSYTYRSSSPRNYGGGRGYGRYQYKAQPYGNVHQSSASGIGPASAAATSALMSKSLTASSSSFAPVYRPQVYEPQIMPQYASEGYKHPPSYPPHSPTRPSTIYPPAPTYVQPPPPPPMSYGPPQQQLPPSAFSTSSAAVSVPQTAPPSAAPAGHSPQMFPSPQLYSSYSQAHAPSFSAQPAPAPQPSAFAPAQSAFAPAQSSFASSQAVYAPPQSGYSPGAPPSSGPVGPLYSPASAPSQPVVAPSPTATAPYVPPGTYRESENEITMQTKSSVTSHQTEKERQTLKKMQEMSQHRAAGSQWEPEMLVDSSQKKKTDEHVEATHQGWSSRSSGLSGEAEKETKTEQETKHNEVDHSM